MGSDTCVLTSKTHVWLPMPGSGAGYQAYSMGAGL
jgi:hypothetical protein